ncbi:MAG: hypothetical protein KDB40_19335 [Acidimicrobiales bacterium]|nr:hypothetical protein [Acidimicrobiales bacterium]
MNVTAPDPLDHIAPDDIADAWTTRGLEKISDGELLRAACRTLSIPRSGEANSFTLHAPLELMARAQLLTSVSARWREPARQRIARIAAAWSVIDEPAEPIDANAIDVEPRRSLTEAVRDGDAERADRAFVALCARRGQDEVVADIVDVVLPRLGGAAHGAIFLELLPRFRPAGINPALMARTLLRDIAHHPDHRLHWFDQPRPEVADGVSLTDRLVSPTAGSEPSSHFVQPTMALVDDTGLAHRTLAGVTEGLSIANARHQLLSIAAMSMLQDAPVNAPYGWTHCLTLPQATLAVAHLASDAQRAIDVAATYVLGFRATQSSGPIDPSWEPDPPSRFVDEVTYLDPPEAAAMTWHVGPGRRAHTIQQLIDHAARHHDAHLAKYTLACLDAATQDPANERLFLAAAAYLAAWWRQHDDTDGASS